MYPYFTTTAMADAIGVAGFCLYVTTYTLLTFRVLTAPSLPYFMMNLTAASCVLIGLTASFNLAATLIQLFWISMSLIGIAFHVSRSRARPSEPRSRPAHSFDA